MQKMTLLVIMMDRNLYSALHDFGFALTPEFIRRSRFPSILRFMDYGIPPCSQTARLVNEKADKVSPFGTDGFQVSMDVTQFKPNELKVKVVNNCIVIEGKHEQQEDNHGYISRQFVRRYALPKNYDTEKIASTLSSDGVLTVSVPTPQAIEDQDEERVIQIQQTGPANLNQKNVDGAEGKEPGK